MIKAKSSRLTVAALVAAAVIVVAGGIATASNVAFKANIGIVLVPQLLPQMHEKADPVAGSIIVSFPFRPTSSPVETHNSVSGTNPAVIKRLNAANGSVFTAVCGFASGSLDKGQGIEVRQQVARAGQGGDATPPGSLIIVGSHDPTFSIDMVAIDPVAGGALGNYWVSVPYHTTWTNVAELCVSTGLDVGLNGKLTIIDPATGSAFSCICGSSCGTSTDPRSHSFRRTSSARSVDGGR
jgi:hypothetical protein